MSPPQRAYLEWSKSYPKKHPDHIKLDNPFYGKYLFQPSYRNEPQAGITPLLQWHYGRTWLLEHKKCIIETKKQGNKPFIKPDIYARKKMLKRMKATESKSIIRSKKYEKIEKKIDNRK